MSTSIVDDQRRKVSQLKKRASELEQQLTVVTRSTAPIKVSIGPVEITVASKMGHERYSTLKPEYTDFVHALRNGLAAQLAEVSSQLKDENLKLQKALRAEADRIAKQEQQA